MNAAAIGERQRGRYAILVLILAAQTVANIGPLGIPAIASLIRDDLGLTLAQAGSFLSAYYIGPILMSLPAGTLADQWGVKRTLVLGQVVIALGLMTVSAAGAYPVLIVLMMIAGVGYLRHAGMQTVWMAFLVLYLTDVVGLPLLAASRYLALAQVAGMAGRIAFGLLSDYVFGGRRRPPLVLAGAGSAVCSLAIAFTGPGASPIVLIPLALAFGFAGIGWNGVQHTLMAELAGPRSAGTAVGLGLAVSSLGVTVAPPLFGWCVERVGGYTGPWIGLALTMIGALGLLALVRERPRMP